MSLIVWLPLNGNLENQGLSNVTVTNNGATVDNNGKIGKCYNFNGTDQYLSTGKTPSQIFSQNGSAFSLCAWVYITAKPTNQTAIISSNNYQQYGIGIGLKTNGAITFMYMNSGKSHEFTADWTLPIGKWSHIIMSYDSIIKKGYLYLDGKLKNTYDITIGDWALGTLPFLIGKNQQGGWPGYFNGKMNDVRIYDHALSAKEIKELSKGLVLHYRLSGPGVPNQARNTSGVYTSPYSSFNGGINTCPYLARVDTSGLKVGDIIHIHLEYKYNNIVPASGQTALCRIQGAGNVTNWNSGAFAGSPRITLSGSGMYIFDYNITITADHLKNEYWSTNIRHDYIQSGSVQWKDFKVEKCSIATPWCPHSADALYSALGYNNNIEYDCSGYRRNGTKSETITWDIDSPRYTTSYKFNGSSCIKNNQFYFNSNIWTVSLWYKYNTAPTAYEGFICLSKNDGSDSNKKIAIMPNSNYIWFKAESTSITMSSLKVGEWCHLAMVSNGTSVIIYENGIQKGTTTISSSVTGAYDLVVGARASSAGAATTSVYNKGNISDVRIYSTALSAEDIAELYHSAVIVDNTGKNYAYEYFEA